MNRGGRLVEAREQAQAQWNTNPCGSVPTDTYDADFFDRVERERYAEQYWQRDLFDYRSYSGKRVLEIGVGLGTDLKQFARHGAECYGADITDQHLNLTRLNFQLAGYDVDLRRADATALPFPDGVFDCVYSFGVIHHIPDVGSVLAEVSRVLKPGGVFQVAVYHRMSLHTAVLFLPALLKGEVFRKGIGGVLSTVERGADGVAIRPYVRLYSKRSLRHVLERAHLHVTRTEVRHIKYDQLGALNFFRRWERALGWYVCAFAQKA